MSHNVRSLVDVIRVILPPIVTTAYLAFCWTVQYRNVVLDGRQVLGTSLENVASIKAGVTTISILIITIGLWPIKRLLTDLQSEEFFRSLNRSKNATGGHHKGINLATANAVSSGSLGMLDTITIILKQRCSPYFTMAFVSGFIIMVGSVLAPAALSVQEAMADSDVMAFEVAALPRGAVVNVSQVSPREAIYTGQMASKIQEAASITWAEAALHINYSFSAPISNNSPESDPLYIVPLPTNLSPTTSARWITDIFVLHPSCTWVTTNITGTYPLTNLSSEPFIQTTTVNIPDLGVDFTLQFFSALQSGNDEFEMQYISVSSGLPYYNMWNSSTGDLAFGGYSIWSISQYYPNFTDPNWVLIFNTTDLPTFGVTDEHGGTFRYATLVCSPNLSIETAEVHNYGRDLTVIPTFSTDSNQRLTEQGNLDLNQASFFLSSLFGYLEQDTSPTIPGLRGSQIQSSLVFGWDQVRSFRAPDWSQNNPMPNGPTTWNPLPLSNITAIYSSYIQSAAKPFMAEGTFGTTFVPGIVAEPVVVFTASRAHVIVSTILLVALNVVSLVAWFRQGKGEVFSLMRVAGVLHESNVTTEVVTFRSDERKRSLSVEGGKEKERNEGVVEKEFEDASRNRILKLEGKGGMRVLVVE